MAQLRMRNKMRKELGLVTIPEDSLKRSTLIKARRASVKLVEMRRQSKAARIRRVKMKLRMFNQLTSKPKDDKPTLFDAAFDNPKWLEDEKKRLAGEPTDGNWLQDQISKADVARAKRKTMMEPVEYLPRTRTQI